MTTIRGFIAVQIPIEVKDALGDVSRGLEGRVESGAIRWVRPEQMHLTLRFLGDTAVAQLPAIQRGMDEAAKAIAPFDMHLGDVGCFPNPRRPRVIWAGLLGDEARLLSLKTVLDQQLTPLGWPPEDKPFRAHLTLGRVKDERAAQGVTWTAPVPRLPVPVAAIHLIESQLRPSGPIYTTRHTSQLSG